MKSKPCCTNPLTLLRQQIKEGWGLIHDVMPYFESLGYKPKEISVAYFKLLKELQLEPHDPIANPHSSCVCSVESVRAARTVRFKGHNIARRHAMPITIYVQYHVIHGRATRFVTEYGRN